MFTLVYNPYLVKWFTRGEGGVKKGQNLVHVVCECPLGHYFFKNPEITESCEYFEAMKTHI